MAQRLAGWWVVVIVGTLLAGCTATRPTVKIGLVAPFEGVHRPLGYAVLYGAQLALQERNAQGGAGGYGVELVALSDDGQAASAGRQAQALAADPGVVGVLGPWQTATAQAAAPLFAQAGLPAVVPAALPDQMLQASAGVYRLYGSDEALARRLMVSVPATSTWAFDGEAAGWPSTLAQVARNTAADPTVEVLTGDGESVARALTGGRCHDGVVCVAGPAAQEPVVAARAGGAPGDLIWVSSLAPVDCHGALADFCAAYTALAGRPPDSYAVLAYDATNLLLDAIAQATSTGAPQRQSVAAALGQVQRPGLQGTLAFDDRRSWAEAPTFLYRRTEESLVR